MSYSSELGEKAKEIYERLDVLQKEWYEKTKFTCPSGCGTCCHGFEPDLLDCEAAFMAQWLIDNKPEVAQALAAGEFRKDYNEKTCIFFDPDNAYHCTIYGGRAFICRLFGASSFRGKEGAPVWKPCKFYPAEMLESRKPPLAHRQYTKEEVEELLGECPPVMADIMGQAVGLAPENTVTKPLREIIPEVIRKLMFEKQLEGMKTE